MGGAEQPTGQDTVTDLAGLGALVGASLGHSEWTEMTQDRVDGFAEVTGESIAVLTDLAVREKEIDEKDGL